MMFQASEQIPGSVMKVRLLMIATVVVLIGCHAPQNDAEKIQGTWNVLTLQESGRHAPEEVLKGQTWVFTKDKVTFNHGAKKMEWNYKLDPSKSPKWIDFTDDKQTGRGIYELDGNNLKCCFNGGSKEQAERSTAFESKPNSVNDVLTILLRQEP
jgi:uncharacterized protein (TIGR03067 family)